MNWSDTKVKTTKFAKSKSSTMICRPKIRRKTVSNINSPVK